MLDPHTALAGALRPSPPAAKTNAPRRVLVLGGGGALGSAVLEQLLSSHRFHRVGVLAQPALQPALRGLQVVPDTDAGLQIFAADTALVVFDRARHANGRDAAFTQVDPAALPARARQLHASGVQHLVVVVPHRPALLPQALKLGLATLDEAAVAALGFQHLVFMRMAQNAAAPAAGTARPPVAARLHGVAGWLLSQLHWLVPQHEQPVRSAVVARVAAALALQLPAVSGGTRVLPPDVLWLAAQGTSADDLVQAWLSGRALPTASVRQRW